MLIFQTLPRGCVGTSPARAVPAAGDQAAEPAGRQKLGASKQKRNHKGGARGDAKGVRTTDDRHRLRKKSHKEALQTKDITQEKLGRGKRSV